MNLPPHLQPWAALIEQTAAKYGLDPALLAGVIQMESGGNAKAVSAAGAVGLGQVMPAEAGFRGRPTREQLFDPATNLDWAARILSEGITRWGTTEQGIAAYLGAINAKGQITGGDPYTGISGNRYVSNVLANAQQYRGGSATRLPATGDRPMADPVRDNLTRQRQAAQTRLSDAQSALQAVRQDPTWAASRPNKDDPRWVAANDRVEAAQKAVEAAQATLDKLDSALAEHDAKGPAAEKPPETRDVNGALYERQPDGSWKVVVEKAPSAPRTSSEVQDAQAARDLANAQLAQTRAGSGLYEAQTDEIRARTDAAKVELLAKQRAADLAAQKASEISHALDLPEGPERTAALTAAVQKWSALESPADFLELGRRQAADQAKRADDLSTQTGLVHDPATLQPIQGPDGQPRLTVAEQQRRDTLAYRAQEQQTAQENARQDREQRQREAEARANEGRMNIAQRASEAAIQAETAHQRDFLPAEAAGGLQPIYDSIATGKMPGPGALTPTILPQRQSPAQVGAQVFDQVMESLASVSPTALAYVESKREAQAAGAPLPTPPVPPSAPIPNMADAPAPGVPDVAPSAEPPHESALFQLFRKLAPRPVVDPRPPSLADLYSQISP